MLKGLFDRFKPVRIEDPFFGSMLYMKAPRGKPSHWEGARSFEPLGQTDETLVGSPGEAEGPSEAQRDFFRRVERAYRSICAAIGEAFRADSWAEQLMPGRFEEDFALGGISIPLCREADEAWDMSFDARRDERFSLCVTMRGSEVQDITVDS